MSETKSSQGVRRQPCPVLDWRSVRTWCVFMGLAIVLGTSISIMVILFGTAVDRLFDDKMPRVIVKLLIGWPILWGLGAIGAQALRRALPLRDSNGKTVVKRSLSSFGLPAFWRLIWLAWAMSFFAVFSGIAVLVRDVAWTFTEGFPWFEMGMAGTMSIIFMDLPIRVLWRVPCQSEGPPDY